MELNDTSILPYGKYKGKPLKDTPAYWLLYMRDQFLQNGTGTGPYAEFNNGLSRYIEENLEVLYKEMGIKSKKR